MNRERPDLHRTSPADLPGGSRTRPGATCAPVQAPGGWANPGGARPRGVALRAERVHSWSAGDRTEGRVPVGERGGAVGRGPGAPGFPAQELGFLGGRHASFLTCRPGRGSKPHSGSGSIRLRALLDGPGNASSRRSGLASGETAVSPYPGGSSGATPSPYRRTVSWLLRSSDSRPSGSHPTPRSPKWGLSSAARRCRRGPPSAALHLLAEARPRTRPKILWRGPAGP